MNVEEDIVDEKDDFESFHLRFRFDNHGFTGPVWKSLREAGWSHDSHNLKYKSPNGSTFDSAKDVMMYLDECAIPEVRGNLDVPVRPVRSNKPNAFREKVTRAVWEHSRTKEADLEDKGLPQTSRSVDATHQRPERKQGLRRSTRDHGPSSNKPSATTLETGTDLYLKKHSRHRRNTSAKHRQQSTSNQSISSESLVVPSLDDCSKALQKVTNAGFSLYRKRFPVWRFILSTNHSLLFYGAGSKYDLLNAFAEEELDKEGHVLVINGFDPDVSMENVMDLLVTLFLKHDPEPLSFVPQIVGCDHVNSGGTDTLWSAPPLVKRAVEVGRALAKQASDTLLPIFLVFHSLEGLGSRLAQEALAAMLANSVVANHVAAIRLVASIDHVDAPMMWSTSASAHFSWIYQKVHTYRPYVTELALAPKKKVEKSRTKIAQSNESQRALEVLKTLAPRHAEVVQILARLQLGALSSNKQTTIQEPQPRARVAYADFREACKAACAVNKDAQLRSFMSELQDHGLIDFRDGWVCIPFDKSKLEEFVAYRPDRA